MKINRLVCICWYEWYWSKSSYFLSTRLSFGWLCKSNSGFSLFLHCQTGGWLVLWQSAVGSSVRVPDKRGQAEPNTQRQPTLPHSSLLPVGLPAATDGRSPSLLFTWTPLSSEACLSMKQIHFVLCPSQHCLSALVQQHPLFSLFQHHSQKENNAVQLQPKFLHSLLH